MAKGEAPDRAAVESDLPQAVVVEVTVLPAADARTLLARIAAVSCAGRRWGLGVLALVLAISAAAAICLGGPDAVRPSVSSMARERGPAGVAEAYGHPLRCLSVTILTTDRSYARADFNRLRPCGRYTGYVTAIFHYASGRWRPILEAVSYLCPVASLPTAVQTALGVCEQTPGDSRL